MSEYRSGDLAELFAVSRETIRRYTSEFKEYLSDSANPTEQGKHRIYTEDDLQVFALVTRLKAANHSEDDIHATLKAGIRDDLPSLLSEKSSLNPSLQLSIAKNRIEMLEETLAQERIESQKWRDEAKLLQGRIEELEKRPDTITLHQEIAVLKYQLKQLQDKE